MVPPRISIPVMILAALLLAAGCASTPAEQLAARDCKVAVADFAGKPLKDISPAEQAAAEMRVSRLAYASGGYRSGTSLLGDISRECD